MEVNTTRFGTMQIPDDTIITMVRGMFGFEQYTRFCMVHHRPDTSFWWMQCIDEPSLAFVVADPAQLFTGYEFDIPDSEVEKLKLKGESDAFVMAVLTVAAGGKEITANLAAPLIVNLQEMLAMQLILQDNRYHVRHPLVLSASQPTVQKIDVEEQELLQVA